MMQTFARRSILDPFLSSIDIPPSGRTNLTNEADDSARMVERSPQNLDDAFGFFDRVFCGPAQC